MNMNQKGIDLIKEFEGFRSEPYLCPASVPTIGYGSTRYMNGDDVRIDDSPISEEYATYLLERDLEEREKPIKKFLARRKVELNDNQFSAIMSFAYNVGWDRVVQRGSVRKCIVQNRISDIPKAMALYNKATIKGELVLLEGLVRRRKAEGELFLS